ncbi:MAG: SpoVG family protein [Planctomycetaceae bacterium]|nr:SpoVG family protein [Planctomycetaceae bacterium]
MEVTEVRIKLMGENRDRLQAFCSITFDGEFVIRDVKVIDGQRGLFIAMPSRKIMARCPNCEYKHEVRARFCSSCGARLPADRSDDSGGRMYADIAHPINADCREKIHAAVMKALQEERIRASQPGYVCNYDDFDVDHSSDR